MKSEPRGQCLGLQNPIAFTSIENQNSQKEASHSCSKFPPQVFVSGPVFTQGKGVESLYWLSALNIELNSACVLSNFQITDHLGLFRENRDCFRTESFRQKRLKMQGLCTNMLNSLKRHSSAKKNHRWGRKRNRGYQTRDSVNPSLLTRPLLGISVLRKICQEHR